MSSGDAAVGMMDAAYFLGRRELLDFFNELLNLNLTKIEQTASGAVACQLTDYIFPGSIPMSRVNWEAKSDYEFIQNYKLLQNAFNKHHVQRHVDVDRLIRAKYQDNLEFCQWLKAFFDQQGVYRPDYDPVVARAKGRGAKQVSQFLDKTASKHNSKPLPSRPRASTRPTTTSSSTAARTTSSRPVKEKENKRGNPTRNDIKTDAIIADANLMKKNTEMKAKLAEMELALGDVEKERDFYFEKLRDVEVMLQVHQEKGEADKNPDRLIENIFKVLYATHEDNYTVDDDGEFVMGGELVDEGVTPEAALDELLTDM
jgi:RP/EB family microtubule-associated protein